MSTRTSAGLFAALLVLACSGSEGPTEPGGPSPWPAIRIEGPNLVRQNQIVRYTATVFDASGNVQNDASVTWSSDATGVISISGSGVSRAIGAGRTTLRATSEGMQASLEVEVTPVRVARLEPGPDLEIRVGQNERAVVQPYDSAGGVISSTTISWSSEDPAVATVSGGTVTGVSEGSTGIIAESYGQVARVGVTVIRRAAASVTIVDDSVSVVRTLARPVNPVVLDATGARLPNSVLRWSVLEGQDRVSVSSEGVLRGVEEGRAVVAAAVDGVADTVVVGVTAAPPVACEDEPYHPRINVEDTVRFSLVARDAFGGVLDVPVTWSSTSPDLATMSDDGLLTAVAPGQATFEAAGQGESFNFTVEGLAIIQGPVAGGYIGSSGAIRLGDTQQLIFVGLDANGFQLETTAEWSSADPAIATVDADGLVTAVGLGNTVITATAPSGFTATVEQYVFPWPVDSIVVADSVVLAPSETRSLDVVALDSLGRVLEDRAVGFFSLDPGVVTVSEAGVLTAGSPGSTRVRVTIENVWRDVPVRVRSLGLRSMEIAAPRSELSVGESVQASVVVRDSLGAVVTGLSPVWSSLTPTVVSVSDEGVVRALSPGGGSVRAAVLGLEAFLTIDVAASPPPAGVTSIAVAPPTGALQVGDSTLLRLRGWTADSVAIDTLTGSWSSEAPAIVTVSESGLLRAVGPGTGTVRVTWGGLAATGEYTVTARPVARIALSPDSLALQVGETTNVQAQAFDDRGGAVSPAVTWSSDAPAVASVDGAGRVTARAGGSTRIVARQGSASASIPVSVEEPIVPAPTLQWTSESLELTPFDFFLTRDRLIAQDANGDTISHAEIEFSSSDSTVVDLYRGIQIAARARLGGTSIIVARLGSVADSLEVRVVEDPRAPAHIATRWDPLPGGAWRIEARTPVLQVQIRDASGAPIKTARLSVEVDDPEVLEYRGFSWFAQDEELRLDFTQTPPDSTMLTLRVDDVERRIPVLALESQGGLDLGALSPMYVDSTQAISLSVRSGRPLSSLPYAPYVEVADTTIATLSADGVLTAIRAGETSIRAWYGQWPRTRGVFVSNAPTSLYIPDTPLYISSINPSQSGRRTRHALVGRDENGTLAPLLGDAPVWSFDDPTLVRETGGYLEAVSGLTGTARATVTWNGLSLETDIHVVGPGLAFESDSIEVQVGQSVYPALAWFFDDAGRSQQHAAASWSSSDPEIARVYSYGLVEALAPGTAVITGDYNGSIAQITVVVRPDQVDTPEG